MLLYFVKLFSSPHLFTSIVIMAPRKTVGILGEIRIAPLPKFASQEQRAPADPYICPPVCLSTGGGQLGRMLAHPASLLGIPLLILDSGSSTPAKQVSLPPAPHTAHPDGAFTSAPHIRQLAEDCDLLTVEIEHVDTTVLEKVEKEGLCEVQPSWKTIRLIQDKYLQKKHLEENGIAVGPFLAVRPNPMEEDWKEITKKLGLPLMLKSRTMAYDGKGNSPLQDLSPSSISSSLTSLGSNPSSSNSTPKPLYAESWAPFTKEIAVMVVRNKAGEVKSYDPVETIHKDSILRVGLVPLRVEGGKGVRERARVLAERAVGTLEGAGIFGVEMFLMGDGECWTTRPWTRLS